MAQDGIILTEAQLQVLEKRRNEKEAYGWGNRYAASRLFKVSGYLLCRQFKGIGKVYSQVFIDSYTRIADAKLYTDKIKD